MKIHEYCKFIEISSEIMPPLIASCFCFRSPCLNPKTGNMKAQSTPFVNIILRPGHTSFLKKVWNSIIQKKVVHIGFTD